MAAPAPAALSPLALRNGIYWHSLDHTLILRPITIAREKQRSDWSESHVHTWTQDRDGHSSK